ncbi:glycosyltransferase family 4 protein [Salegentibacter sp. JZCK2]|uniref:glycosyltransferase family 4 protein n=1 Tax=Salegentibacter tibetensis TaxID=2873600 RepID=UPI001CCB5E08|nr:glycosyltransferase family 4 protein [Salegentibacter tibetensis]MBZ9728691.1 glycosyltransferase family 4 protein [Salegentibacter tibetensis]
MHIGIASPITISEFFEFLDEQSKELSKGVVGLKAPAVDTVAKELLKQGHTISIYTLANEVSDLVILNGDRLKIYIGPFKRKGFFKAITIFNKEAGYIEKSIRLESKLPDIIHANWTYEFALGSISFKNKIPIVVTVRDWAPLILQLNKNYYRFSRLILNNKIFRTPSIFFISNSPYIQGKIESRWKIKTPVIPNPVNENFVSTPKIHNDSFSPVLISVSNGLGKLKNIETLLRAFQLVLMDKSDARLRLVGSPFLPQNAKMKKWDNQGLLKNVELLGTVKHEDLISLYDEATVMVHPSLEESFGNTLIEAMARKVPVIGGMYSGAVPYVLDYGKSGFLCDVTSIESIGESILVLLKDQKLRQKLIKNATERIANKFSSKAITEQSLKLYSKLIQEAK